MLRYHSGMWLECPECGAGLEGTSGAEVVCPACMTPFLVPSGAKAVRAFDVQPAGEAVLHDVSRHAIREAIYVGRFTPATKVRHGGGKWELIGGYPEFAAVFRLLGEDLAPMAGTRKLAGWKRAGASPDTSSPRLPPVSFEVNGERPPVEPAVAAPTPPAALPPGLATPPAPVRGTTVPKAPTAPRPGPTDASGALYLVGGVVLAALILGALLLR